MRRKEPPYGNTGRITIVSVPWISPVIFKLNLLAKIKIYPI